MAGRTVAAAPLAPGGTIIPTLNVSPIASMATTGGPNTGLVAQSPVAFPTLAGNLTQWSPTIPAGAQSLVPFPTVPVLNAFLVGGFPNPSLILKFG
jgi:hypothetical protein